MIKLKPDSSILGRTVVGHIGQGGMGAVYKLFDKKLKRHYALKVMAVQAGLPPELMADLEQRFEQEARNLAAIRDPGVVTIHDFGELFGPGTEQYLLMEYLPGQDLMAVLRDGPQLTLEEILQISKQLASALSAIHRRDMLHRDLKLSNILLTRSDGQLQAVIIDFGLAKTNNDPNLTQVGHLAGTSRYFAPEYITAAFESQPFKHTVQTDLWALGCVIYGLCTCRSLWTAKNDIAIQDEIRKGQFTPVEQYRTDISDEFAQVIAKLLSVDTATRTKSAMELHVDLTRISVARDASKPAFVPPGKKHSHSPSGAATRQMSPSEDRAVDASMATAASAPVDKPASSGGSINRATPMELNAGSMEGLSFPSAEGPSGGASLFDDDENSPLFPVSSPGQPLDSLSAAQLNSAHARLAPKISTTPPESLPIELSASGASLWSAELEGAQLPSRLTPAIPPAVPDDTSSIAVLPAAVVEKKAKEKSPAFVPEAVQAPTSVASRRAIIIPALMFIVVATTLSAVVMWSQNKVQETKTAATFVDPEAIQKERGARELAKLKKETSTGSLVDIPNNRPAKTGARNLDHVAVATPADIASTNRPNSRRVSRSGGTSRRNTGRSRRGQSAKQPAVSPAGKTTPVENEYAALYGSRAADTPMTGDATIGRKAAASETATSTSAGVRIPVRLKGTIVSTPSGPVIAIVTKTTKVGDYVLTKGSEVHGTSKGAKGALIQVGFKFARSRGVRIPLKGRALAPDGRTGIPARPVAGGSDVVAAATEAGLRAIGEGAAKTVGDNPLGAAIRGGTSPAAAKGKHLDRSVKAYKTRRNVRFLVYVEG